MKIPSQAKRVYSGIIFDVYHWEQKLYNGQTRTFEMIKRIPAVSILPIVKNKILIIEQQQPGSRWYHSLPGGKIDDGETPLAAAIRELREETGYSASKAKLYRSYNEYSKIDYDDYLYITNDCVKAGPQELDGGEKIKVKLVSFDAFLKLVHEPWVAIPRGFQHEMWEALISKKKKAELKKKLGLQ